MPERTINRPYGQISESQLSSGDGLLRRISHLWSEAVRRHDFAEPGRYGGSVIPFGAGFFPASFADGGVLFFLSKNGKRQWEKLYNYYGDYDYISGNDSDEDFDDDVFGDRLIDFTEEFVIPRILESFDAGNWTYYRGNVTRSVNMVTGEY